LSQGKKLGKCPLFAKVVLCGRHALLWLRLVAASVYIYSDVREEEKYFCPKPKQRTTNKIKNSVVLISLCDR
jgi:hypothetical protein